MKLRWCALAGGLLLAQLGNGIAEPALSQLRSFGLTNSATAYPLGEALLGHDNALYGTTAAGGTTGQGTVYRATLFGVQVLKSFGTTPTDGIRPAAGLLEASDGGLYGTTEEGGAFGFGTLFRLNEDGTGYTVLWSFTGTADGGYPEARLLEGSDGLLYGTTSGGGTNDYGVVFSLAKDGTGFQTLAQFVGTNGANPEGGLSEASDGRLYGTTLAGGVPAGTATAAGTVFSLDKSGSNFMVLRTFLRFANPGQFTLQQTNGYAPYGRVVETYGGRLYGTTWAGGTNGTGTIYGINKDGSGFQVLHHFGSTSSTDGRFPVAELLEYSGLLWGTTYDGGPYHNGSLFRIDPSSLAYLQLPTLPSLQGFAAALTRGKDLNFYGTCQMGGAFGAGALFLLNDFATACGVVANFSPSGGDGQSPYASLAQASDGRLYGTTRLGGGQGGGSLFSLRYDGQGYQQVYSFTNGSNGPIGPVAPVIEDGLGLLYGTTQFGGVSSTGALFSVNKNGASFISRYSFPGNANGQEPRGALLQGSDGYLYGTTVLGGANGRGVLFRANPGGGSYQVLKSFSTYYAGGPSGPGGNPVQGVIEGSDHLLYGTTYDGGTVGYGTLYQASRDGTSFTVLKTFTNALTEGAYPASPLLEGSDGFLYGTTYGGGPTDNAGTLFRIAKDGSGFQMLHGFTGLSGDARHPCGRLVQGADGVLYGTTERGGLNQDAGTLYTFSTSGAGYAVLASFGGALGAYPRGGLSVGPDGAVYGTTDQGGPTGLGTVFRFGAPLGSIAGLQFSPGLAVLTCVGAAGTNYWLERSEALGPAASWAALCSTNAPDNGQFSLQDQSPPAAGAFYRVRW